MIDSYNNDYKYIDEFIEYIKVEKKYSQHTLRSYEDHLHFFFQWIQQNFKQDIIKNIKKKDIKIFITSLYNLKFKSSTIAAYISTLKSFYKFMYKNNIIEENIMINIKYPKKEKKLPNILYNSELQDFFKTIDITQKWGKRNRALVYLLYTTGIRVHECINIKLDDIDYKEKNIQILGKGNKERFVYLHDQVLNFINVYIETERTTFNNDFENYLFINNKGGHLTERGVRYILNTLSEQAALNMKVNPHTFRHTFATNLLNNGMDLRYVQELLGHESLSSTEVYTHISQENMIKNYNNSISRK